MAQKLDKEQWNWWFAGLTDGDGCFYISTTENNVSFELTTATSDIRVLNELKKELKGGNIKSRSNAKAVRYRVKAKNVVVEIVSRLHGKLRNPVRIKQYERACVLLNIPKTVSNSTDPLKQDCPYLQGLLDSDGTIAISIGKTTELNSQISGTHGKIVRLEDSKGHGQLYARVTSVYKTPIQLLIDSYGFGTIYNEEPTKDQPTYKIKYHWTIKTEDDFLHLYNLCKKYPLRSVKMHRLRLSILYFKYKNLNYHLKGPQTIEFKIWQKFCKSWFKYSA